MEKRKILLIGGNYFPEPTGIGKYNGEMMKWLAEQGHSCTVITTFPYYPQWKVQDPYVNQSFWFKTEWVSVKNGQPIKVIRCPHYVPKTPSGIARLISEFSFFFTAYIVIVLMLFRKKFDFVVTVAPPFEIGLLGLFYKKIRGCKFLYHIQDLQIDAAQDLSIIKSKGIIGIFLSIERFIIKYADSVSTISAGMIEKVKGKCKREVLLFPNWVDINAFYPLTIKDELKLKYGFNPSDKIILYSGAIGNKQGLESILYAAKRLEHQKDFKFAICGSGPYKENLTKLKDEMNLQNVVFLPLQPLNMFNSFLNMADVHLVLQKAKASDLVLPSKLSTILSVGGVAIVTAQKGSSLYDIMSSTNMGIIVEPDNQEALVAAISNIADSQHEEKVKNARKYAEQNLSTDKILNEFFSVVLNFRDENHNIKPVFRDVGAAMASASKKYKDRTFT
ncbi:MAG TPA: WcaI family glycosyltransferase [Segetibacter sp.]